MNTTRLTQFRRAFALHEWTPAQRRYYARKWARCIRNMGNRWLLAEKVQR